METLLWKQVNSMKIVPSLDFETSNNEILADEVIIDLGEQLISIIPLIDTDELEVRIFEASEYVKNTNSKPVFKKYTGAKLSYTWDAVNTKGYKDVFMMAFDNLIPAIMVLSEGSVLKLFDLKGAIGV
jgi:hypothetical protein